MEIKQNGPNATTQNRPYKRHVKNILIHRPMQREFSLMLILLFILASGAVAWVIHYTINDAAFGSNSFYFGKVSPTQVLSDVTYSIIMRVTLILIMTLVIIAIYGIVFLHRVAGPVYRFRQTLLKLNRGEYPPEVHIRENDFFHELAHEINGVLKKLGSDETVKRLHGQSAKLDEMKRKLDEIIRISSSEEMRQKAQEVKSNLENLSK